MRNFYEIPIKCLALGARRYVNPVTKGSALQNLVPPVRTVMSKPIISSDPAERAHAQFRQDAKGATQARGYGDTNSRVFCRSRWGEVLLAKSYGPGPRG